MTHLFSRFFMTHLKSSIPRRSIIPFSSYVLIFAGWSELLLHSAWLSIIWTIFLIGGIIFWLIQVMEEERSDTHNLLALAQFCVVLANLAYIVIGDNYLILCFYFILLILVTIPLPRRIAKLASLELALLVFYQSSFLHAPHPPLSLLNNAVIALTLGLGGFMLSFTCHETTSTQSAKAEELVDEAMDISTTINTVEGQSFQDDELSFQLDDLEERKERIKKTIEIIHDILSPFTTLFFDLNRDRGHLTIADFIGDETYINSKVTIEVGKGPIGWVAKNGLPLHWEKALGEKEPAYYQEKTGVETLLAVPVLDRHFLAGVLVVDSRKQNAFSSKDEKVMDVFARQLALLFETQDLIKLKREETEEYKFLDRVGTQLIKRLKLTELLPEILNQLRVHFNLHHGLILLHDTKTNKLEVKEVSDQSLNNLKGQTFDLMEGLAGWIFQNQREPGYFADTKKMLADQPLLGYGATELDPKSILYIPLHSVNQTLGLVLLMSDDEQSFQITEKVLRVLANQYSMSLINANMYYKLEQMSVTDGLTQLINHRYLQEILSQEFKRYERDSIPFSLIMIDIDHFKKINDTYGHPVGDKVLIRVAHILKNSCREIDHVARYGGEEFATLLINTDSEGAKQTAERIRQSIAQDTLLIGDVSLRVTASLGIATCPDNCIDKRSLIDYADQALYQAKETGRNRIVHFNELDEVVDS